MPDTMLTSIHVYQAPGRPVAVLYLPELIKADPHPTKNCTSSAFAGRLSADGRTLHILGISPMSEGHTMALRHFKW